MKTNAGKIWIPKKKKRNDNVMLLHFGTEKVTKYVADNYYMSSINELIKGIISKCEACQKIRVVTTRTKKRR